MDQRTNQNGIWKYFELNENENTFNLWNAAKAILKKKLISLNANIRKEEASNQ